MAIARPEAPHGNLRDFDLAALLLGFGFGEPGPRDLRIGEDHGGNRRRLEHRLVPGDRFDGDARFVRRLVRQHRLARDVADREDRRLLGAALEVGLDEALVVDLDPGPVEAVDPRVRPAADRDQHVVVGRFLRRALALEA